MKSVKNFLIERMSSTDQSTEQLSDGTAEVDDMEIGIVSAKNASELHKLNVGNTLDSADIGNDIFVDVTAENAKTNVIPICADEYADMSSNYQVIDVGKGDEGDERGNTGSADFEIVNFNEDKLSVKLRKTSISGEHIDGGKRSPAHKALPPLDFNKRAKEFQCQDSGALTAPILKARKEHRKISLPWFRQSSVSKHFQLNRQHTIDTPGSFFSFRHTSSFFKVASQETTWVIADYISTPGTNELSVTKGQQVEIVEAPTTSDADFCLVRLISQADDAAVLEGLVPISILKPVPNSAALTNNINKNSNTQRTDSNETTSEQANNRSKADPLISATKRRGFSGRSWLPPPLRKLSQSKGEKPPEKTLIKKSSEKHLRQLSTQKHTESEEGNGSSTHNNNNNSSNNTSQMTSANTTSMSMQHNSSSQLEYEADEEAGLELPPPMKPIQEPPHLIANGPTAFTNDMKDNSVNMNNSGNRDGKTSIDLSEIEQIVKEKTEQHEEKSKFMKPNFEDRNSSREHKGRTGDLELPYNNYGIKQQEENKTESVSAEAAQKRNRTLEELLSTEETYVQDLSDIVNGYIAEMRNPNSNILLPDDLKVKERIIFGNIESLYDWHKKVFLVALKRCKEFPSELGVIFTQYERKFQMYNVYCQTKKLSDHIVTENNLYFDQIKRKLNHRVDLASYLIKPVQRIMKYQLLLNEILTHTKRAGLIDQVPGIEQSCKKIRDVCRNVDHMMELCCLQNYDGIITAQGKLLKYGPLFCIEDSKNHVQKLRELQVFLFEKTILFADIVGKRTQFTSPNYMFRTQIQVNNMHLEQLPNNRFLLKSTDPNRPELVNIICYASTNDVNNEWYETINTILKTQIELGDALTSPIKFQELKNHNKKTSATSSTKHQ